MTETRRIGSFYCVPDTLIAVHGGPGLDLESIYGDFVAMLGDRHTIIFYDQRGGGKSELPDVVWPAVERFLRDSPLPR